jgi:thymidylate kinase
VENKMLSIALIGPDGAGKTTLTRRLEQSRILPFKYLYMGVDISASNLALPSSRLAERLKRRERNGSVSGARAAPSDRQNRGRLRAVARLANRLAEEWFRQLVSWFYQRRGFVVLYDRHFVFDFAPEIAGDSPEALDKRLHRWALTHLYPRPGLVIFLDAPGAVLFARKRESTAEELERRRQAFLRQGERFQNFVCVDATRPLETVYDEIVGRILEFASGRRQTVGRVPA